VEEVAKALYFSQKELDTAKMIEFARKIGNSAVIKRLGYIAETLSLDNYADMISRIGIKSGYSIFDPTMPAKGHIKERWKLVVNSRIEPRKWMA
jgi:predicted transcriptional regulator of viral defense system